MPFTRNAASADTCVLSDFLKARRPDLLARLFPDGIRVDASVVFELTDSFGYRVCEQLADYNCHLMIERDYEPIHYSAMATIKQTRPALRHPDIATLVLAEKYQLACLSSDKAVRKTCGERGILIAGHIGCLKTCVERRWLDPATGVALLNTFKENGLYLPADKAAQFLDYP